jgi:uncharacterized repeat protein (TIGR03803 family)
MAVGQYSLPSRPRERASSLQGNAITEALIFSFSAGNDGPYGGLGRDKAGDFYGVAYGSGNGVIFDVSSSGSGYVLKRLYVFQGGYVDGQSPNIGLVRDESQALYGTTQDGGEVRYCNPPGGCGVAFKLTPSRGGYKSTILYRFQGGADGANPTGGLIADASGNLYGTTLNGGPGPMCSDGCGTVFKFTPSSGGYIESVLYTFQGGSNGQGPGNLTMDASGALYGVARGGTYDDGVVFKLRPSDSGYLEDTLYSFKGGTDGAFPSSPIVIDKAGNLYGTVEIGGDLGCPQGFGNGCGSVFKLTAGGRRYHERVLYAFQGGSDGGEPFGLTLAGDLLYGVTNEGGSTACGNPQGCGTVYALKRRKDGSSEHVLYGFPSGGSGPVTGLIVEKDGTNIFGEVEYGGANNDGAIFEITQ